MKEIYLIYNQFSEEYIINEKEPTSDGVPQENIKKSLDKVVNFLKKYKKRKLKLRINVSDDDAELLKNFLEKELEYFELKRFS